MAEEAPTNPIMHTRIQLKHDSSERWENSELQLRPGELAFSTDTKHVKIGGGTPSTWKNLDEIHVSVSAVDGLDQVSATHYECGDISELTGEYKAGDTAVAIKEIADGKKSYTAYVYDGPLSAWKAMDGNYSAENVYLEHDLAFAGDYTLGNVKTKASATYTAPKGTNVADMLKDIFTKEISATVTQPSVTVNTGNTNVEYGSTVTPSYSFKLEPGSYSYGPETGVAPSAWAVKCGGETVTPASQTANPLTGSASETTLTANYVISASASYGAGAVPVTNMGNETPGLAIQAGSKANSKTTYTVYKPHYWMFTAAPTGNPVAGASGSMTGWTTELTANNNPKTSFTASAQWYELFYIMPHGKKASWSGKDSNGMTLAVNEGGLFTYTFPNGATEQYDLFVVRNTNPYDPTICTMKWA